MTAAKNYSHAALKRPRDIVLDADSRPEAIQHPKVIEQGRAQSYGELQKIGTTAHSEMYTKLWTHTLLSSALMNARHSLYGGEGSKRLACRHAAVPRRLILNTVASSSKILGTSSECAAAGRCSSARGRREAVQLWQSRL